MNNYKSIRELSFSLTSVRLRTFSMAMNQEQIKSKEKDKVTYLSKDNTQKTPEIT